MAKTIVVIGCRFERNGGGGGEDRKSRVRKKCKKEFKKVTHEKTWSNREDIEKRRKDQGMTVAASQERRRN